MPSGRSPTTDSTALASPEKSLSRRVRFIALLHSRNFALFFTAFSISTLGTAAVPVALTFALLSAGYTASAVGVVLAAQTAPTVLLMLVGGVVGDRWSRRRVMVGADLLRCASQTTLATWLTLGHPHIVALMGLAAACGVGAAFYGPAETGLIPQIAAIDQVKSVNSFMSLSSSLAAILGPALGGLLVSFGGASVAIGLDAASYAVSASCLSLMRLAFYVEPPRSSLATDLRSGWSEFNRRRWLQLLTVQQGVLNLLVFAPFFVLGPSMFASVPHGARIWGFIASATGAGGIAGGLVALRIHITRPLLGIQLATAMLATPLVMLALHASEPLLAAGSAIFGFALVTVNIILQTSLQESIPAEFLSRVGSIVNLAILGLGPIGFALCGPAARLFGTERLLGSGAAALLLSVAVLLCSRNIRRFSRIRIKAPPT